MAERWDKLKSLTSCSVVCSTVLIFCPIRIKQPQSTKTESSFKLENKNIKCITLQQSYYWAEYKNVYAYFYPFVPLKHL